MSESPLPQSRNRPPNRRTVFVLTALAAVGVSACSEAQSENAPEGEMAPEPEVEVSVVPAATRMAFGLDRTVSTDTDEPGTVFTASLLTPVDDATGHELVPAGASSRWTVTEASTEDGRSVLAVELTEVDVHGQWIPVTATVTAATIDTDHPDSDGETAAKIGVGTAAGALVGQILGGDSESTLTGAGVGAAVGTAVALSTRGGHATMPEGSVMEVELVEEIRIR